MSVWDIYKSRIDAHGGTVRNASLVREKRRIQQKIVNSLSYHSVLIDGVDRNVSIANSDNLNEKVMFSMPGEDIDCGGLVEWADNKWLITEKDANNEIYTKVKLLQCNYLLRWVDKEDKIHEQWCVVEDGTKYLTGELEDRNFIASRGDSRISMTIAKNEHTTKFTREDRFLVDDPEREHKMAYALTKPLMTGWTYNGKGIFSFVLQEVVATDDDNFELSIADYYKHFPKEVSLDHPLGDVINPDNVLDDGRKVWL